MYLKITGYIGRNSVINNQDVNSSLKNTKYLVDMVSFGDEIQDFIFLHGNKLITQLDVISH